MMALNSIHVRLLTLVILFPSLWLVSDVHAVVPDVDCTIKAGTAYVSGAPKPIDLVTFAGKPVSTEIVDPLYVMVMAAHADGVDLNVASGFRTYEQQEYLYNCYKNCNCNDCNLAAKPGYSNHQSGHAVDITTGCSFGWSDDYCASQSTAFAWLIKNAGYYGFEKTVDSEPWHWEWWEGGPGGGICFDSCKEGCVEPSANEVDPMQKVNEGWIGGFCESHAECGSPGGFCFQQAEGFAYGMCSEPCEKYCPDTPGAVVTFCVAGKELGVDSPEGTCVAKCDQAKGPGGCRPGYECKTLPRFNDPGTKAPVCIPMEGGNKAISPKGWSTGKSTQACSFSRCALEFGNVCSDDTPNGPACVNALCVDANTQAITVGNHCSYLYSNHGTAVNCGQNGDVLESTLCSAENPCNACGTCGKVPDEVCDGIDNNCDGEVDEGLLNACGQCGEAPQEICDGEDNDCDGEIDEGLLNACGQCGEAPQEICDGEDNNCDGEVDEGLLNACGQCGEAPQEICDGEDNNCDGEIDEGCPSNEADPDSPTSDTVEPQDEELPPQEGDTMSTVSPTEPGEAGCSSSGGLKTPWLLLVLMLFMIATRCRAWVTPSETKGSQC